MQDFSQGGSAPIEVIHTSNYARFSEMVGKLVGTAKVALADIFNLPDDAASFVNGQQVDEGRVLLAGDVLEFIVCEGRKGINRLMTRGAINAEYHLPASVIERLFREVDAVEESGSGDPLYLESQIDRWLTDRYTKDVGTDLRNEWYTIREAEKLTKYKAFTLRQACNLGRLPDEYRRKDHRTGKWRLSREAIEWLRENDLPSLRCE